jgi:hypothetical protein
MSPVVSSASAPTGDSESLTFQGFYGAVSSVSSVSSKITHMRMRIRAHAHTPARLALETPETSETPETAGPLAGGAAAGAWSRSFQTCKPKTDSTP